MCNAYMKYFCVFHQLANFLSDTLMPFSFLLQINHTPDKEHNPKSSYRKWDSIWKGKENNKS